jgi:hypothetical protein
MCFAAVATPMDYRAGNDHATIVQLFRYYFHAFTTTFAFVRFSTPGQIGGVNISINNEMSVFLDNQCTHALVYPGQMYVYAIDGLLINTQSRRSRFNDYFREDAVLIIVHSWLLGISLVAIVYESIPHL